MADFNEGIDGKLAFRMRKVNPEQFHTLVKMHLSFELDLNTEDNDCIIEKAKLKKWGIFARKPKSTINLQKLEGVSLSENGINQVKQLIEYLSKEQSIIQEGIFRRTGKLTRQQDLKNALYQGVSLNLEDGRFSVHDCASVLKGFLAELSEPLLTDLHFPAHCQIAELCNLNDKTNEARLLRSLQLLLLLLPPPNRHILKCVLNLLNKTATFEHNNKMNCDSLATLFTPHLLCPRKLSPEALHINSQNLSCLVAFMIKKSVELFDIPPKLATDIRAYWIEQERKLLSPKKSDLDESVPDTTGTAHTVFSFVDHKLTAKANSTQDTQAALAQLYAHIQAMPESAKKRRLVKQFNKENGQGTPRHVKNIRTKSLGDSIKKHIFQRKLLSNKKFIDINIGCNITRSSSEENILSTSLEKPFLQKTRYTKSDDEFNIENSGTDTNNLVRTKHISNSTGSINAPTATTYKSKRKVIGFVNISDTRSNEELEEIKYQKSSLKLKKSFVNSSESYKTLDGSTFIHEEFSNDEDTDKNTNLSSTSRLSRQSSEPPDMYSSQVTPNTIDSIELVRQNSEPVFSMSRRKDMEVDYTPKIADVDTKCLEVTLKYDSCMENACSHPSPRVKNRFWNVYAAHTSTPSSLLRKSLVANDYILTPITNNDKSMSPITQSATKMTKAMQETMMTPRSRKPVMMVSGSNLCDLASMNESSQQKLRRPDSPDGEFIYMEGVDIDDKENLTEAICQKQNLDTSNADECCTMTRQSSMSITSTFREYLLSRSVLTASPVDLSFTSRTDDFEQSESDINILNEDGLSSSLLRCLDGNNPESDTSGIASGSANSANDSSEKIEEIVSPRKRGTSLQRNDSKRSIKDKNVLKTERGQSFKYKQISESRLNSTKVKDTFQETSF
ncbi:PREDICTED: uncharacterized protein LOC106792821 isoform X2 [Polistes canadensis]|uniref:uncharacterized protein LOC106792821 isoform X2 n=1 Tax=Polistes canadensis TaxID=91411 RepID=UPI000718C146|nr:PREDICTED: uncharacterized protein LOC106792821 isoform X2 [Polistes canadensis]